MSNTYSTNEKRAESKIGQKQRDVAGSVLCASIKIRDKWPSNEQEPSVFPEIPRWLSENGYELFHWFFAADKGINHVTMKILSLCTHFCECENTQNELFCRMSKLLFLTDYCLSRSKIKK